MRKISLKEDVTADPLDGVLKSMYDSAIDLQKMQGGFEGQIAKIAIMGMSADISKLLMRFRKISAALKSGNETKLKQVLQQESKKIRLQKLIREFIVEELNKKDVVK